MKPRLTLALLAFAAAVFAQTPPTPAISAAPVLEDPTVMRKRFDLDKIRAMVENGTLPRVRLERAQEELLDAEDEAIITRALYGKDITQQQASDTVSAAQRRMDRRKKTADEMQKMVATGIISVTEATTATDDLERSKKDYEWAVDRAKLVQQVETMAAAEADLMRRLETASPLESRKLAEYYPGKGSFTPLDLQRVQSAYIARFQKPLPISANGESAVHRSMGFDHRGRVDVALRPDQPEGIWLRHYLTVNHIPFFAFRAAIAHQATGAHIHMGPPSGRYNAAMAASSASGS